MSGQLDPEALAVLATRRSHSLFAADLAAWTPKIREAVEGGRVLVIGGAGSIGSATVRTLLPFGPAHVHVVDQNENALAEFVRDLRSGAESVGAAELRALPLNFRSAVMRRFLDDEPPYDLVLNFAALKHVRSEKDIYSLTQLLDTNVVGQARLLEWLAEGGTATRYFCVSTDKAANPVSLMGASKRLMEHVVFSGVRPLPAGSVITSARFANVAFSAGSLLASFLQRIPRRQPLAVPKGTRRYFVSLAEAGQICVMAATGFPARHIAVPRLNEVTDLRPLEEIAVGVVERSGWTPLVTEDAEVARAALRLLPVTGRYPILLTPLDTSGEKPFEVFLADGERAVDVGLGQLDAVPYCGGDLAALGDVLDELQALAEGESRAGKLQVVEWVRRVMGTFEHAETGRHLDTRM